MSTHRKYVNMWLDIDGKEISVGYEQDDCGMNYVDIPLTDIMDELAKENVYKSIYDNTLKSRIEAQQKTIERLQKKLYEYRMVK